ncbi:DUF2026 domain-containing protein [Vibrio parahaemolyticus]|nr:DUF2026 domain-containing protein [Vibrio parahaemolyticus]
MKITLPDYFRIYSIMHSVLKSENADTNKSCSFYNYCGAYILNEHYKLPAKVYSGFAAYHLDGWLIDFMAPEFSNVLKELTSEESVPRKMMQKQLSKMVEYAEDISQAGDFLLLPDLEVTNAIMSNIEKQPAFIDLIEICSKWYCRKPDKMSRSIQISDGRGSIKEVSIEDIAPIVGAW